MAYEGTFSLHSTCRRYSMTWTATAAKSKRTTLSGDKYRASRIVAPANISVLNDVLA
jgi:hypothetical protein